MSDKPKKILVVDDEPDAVTYLTSLLEDNGYETVSAYDGKEGMELAKKEQPDLISLDITMPEETGVRMLRNLHADPETRDIPVVLVTGMNPNFKSFIRRQRQIPPPAAYFEKPINTEEYLAGIRKILG
ncbi:MAG: response regulator [Planctomycetota bacterium]